MTESLASKEGDPNMQTLKINVGSTTVAEAQELRTINHSGQILPAAQAFVSALTSADEDQLGNNPMLTFDTDSSFWVCNNSATGNICNDIKHYHGKLVPSIYSVGATTGTSSPELMGTVILWITDDKGVQHTITLKEVIYMKDFPVNILSTRRLA